jgi:hypothetical protein
MDDIICPHCGKKVQIDAAIRHQMEKTILKESEEKQKIELEKVKTQIAKETEEKLKQENKKEIDAAIKENEELKKKFEENLKEQEKNEEKIKENAIKKAQDEQSIKLKEKDIQMDQIKKLAEDLRKANEDLKKKLEQGSQQLQGEALELDLEEKLKATFPNDEFLPVPKGVEGGDILQKVKFNGKAVGSIIWETKRTKAWSNSWLTKLKDDAQQYQQQKL